MSVKAWISALGFAALFWGVVWITVAALSPAVWEMIGRAI